MSQLKQLAKPFHASLIEQKPGQGDLSYVNHASVTERVLATLGPYSLKVEQLIFNPEGKVDGALVTVTVEIDGHTVSVTEAGEGDNPRAKTNGALAKDAISDAVKRCWMRLGLGLHLWSGQHYVLDKVLERNEAVTPTRPQMPVEAKQEKPVEDEPRLSQQRAETMTRELEKMGLPKREQLKLAGRILEHEVASFADLTETEAKAVWSNAKQAAQGGGTAQA